MIRTTAHRLGRPSRVSALLGGAMVGGAFGIASAAFAASASRLPLTSQLITFSLWWLASVTAGLVASAVFATLRAFAGLVAGRRTGRAIWAPWFAFAVLLWAEVTTRSSADPVASAVLGALLASLCLPLLVVLGRRIPRLETAGFWCAVNVVGVFALVLSITFAGPLDHGAEPAALVALLPPIAVVGIALALFPNRVARRALSVAAVLLALVVVASVAVAPRLRIGEQNGTDGRINVLLITVDTLRADHVGCYGSGTARTPNVDRLAEEGVLFENTASPMPLTNPSHTSILTGLRPAEHGVTLNTPRPLREGVTTLPALLGREGYRTAAFVSGFTLRGEICRLRDEFEVYDDDMSPVRLIPDLVANHALARLALGLLRPGGAAGRSTIGERSASRVVDAAGRWLGLNADAPFFLWVHLFDPHGPYEPPAPYDRLYDPEYEGAANGSWGALPQEERLAMIERPEDLAHVSALYAGEVSFADAGVGRLLATVARLGLTERTLIVFTSDHGESLTEHDYYFDHSVCLYDPSLMVPLIIRFPGAEFAGTTREELVEIGDVCPTVAEFLRVDAPPTPGASSLVGLCAGIPDDGHDDPVISVVFRGEIVGGKSLLSVRTRSHKYVRTSAWFADLRVVGEAEEFYDLSLDPGELSNVVGEPSPALDRLRAIAAEHWEAWRPDEPGPAASIPARTRETLRSLGYLG